MSPEPSIDSTGEILVSVVVPVYNPGPYMSDLIASLRRQSIGLDHLEAVFVDDGSTDGSGEFLEHLAATERWVRVIRQPNSGWPGKPRNVGIDAARGEFIMFADQDDWLGDEALERMRDYGISNDADVIVGKMIGIRRGVPKALFRKDHPRASVSNTQLVDSLTPHKMFRASFLRETGLRFPEGKRRLEDHVFVTEAYLRARNVSVLSSYDCYFHISRNDGGNAGFAAFDIKGYYRNLREAMDIAERHLPAGRDRDVYMNRWVRIEILRRLRGSMMSQLDDAGRRELAVEAQNLFLERITPTADARLSNAYDRFGAAVLRHGTPEDVIASTRVLDVWKPNVSIRSASRHGGRMVIELDAHFEHGDRRIPADAPAAALLEDVLSEPARAALPADGELAAPILPARLTIGGLGEATWEGELGAYILDLPGDVQRDSVLSTNVEMPTVVGKATAHITGLTPDLDADPTDVATAASDAGTPAPSRRGPLPMSEHRAELFKGYLEHFQQWGGPQNLLMLVAMIVTLLALATSSALVVLIGSAAVLLLVVLVRQKDSWLGRHLAPRLILLPGAFAAGAVSGLLDVLLTIVFALVITGEAFLHTPSRRIPAPPAANLPGMEPLPTLKRTFIYAFRLFALAEFALIVFIVAGWPYIAMLPVIASVALLGYVAVKIKMARARHHRMVVRKHDELAALQPRFLVHWDGPAAGMYQVAMWTEYLTATGLPYAVIVRNDRHVEAMAQATGVPVVHIGDSVDVDRSVLPSLFGIVYVNTSLKNGHYIRFTHLKHIQINHGDSDKPASASKAFRMFDANLVAGQAAVDRFRHYGVHVPPELIRIVGRPQVEGITPDRGGERQTVLYAPTWAGFFGDSDFSSLRQGESIVDALLARGKTVVFRPHSFTGRTPELAAASQRIKARLRADREASGRQHVFGAAAESDLSIIDCFNVSDAMIADVSSIVSDYLFSEKPLAMVAANTPQDRFRSSFPVSRRVYVIDGKLVALDTVLEDMLGADTGRAERLAARDYYLGDFGREGYAKHFVDALREELLLGGTTHG